MSLEKGLKEYFPTFQWDGMFRLTLGQHVRLLLTYSSINVQLMNLLLSVNKLATVSYQLSVSDECLQRFEFLALNQLKESSIDPFAVRVDVCTSESQETAIFFTWSCQMLTRHVPLLREMDDLWKAWQYIKLTTLGFSYNSPAVVELERCGCASYTPLPGECEENEEQADFKPVYPEICVSNLNKGFILT